MKKNISSHFSNSSSKAIAIRPFVEEVQFTYYIVPAGDSDSAPIVWAITTTAYTITAYTQPTSYNPLTSHLQPAAAEYAANVSHTFEIPLAQFRRTKGFYVVRRNDPGHHYLHSTERGEFSVTHYHVRNHSRPLTVAIVRDFIKIIQHSEQELIKTHKLPKGERFMTHQVRQDIISRYTDFRARQARGEVRGIYNASNSEFYEKHINQFTIGTHGKCLELPTRFMGCTLDNPSTPEAIRTLYLANSVTNPTFTETETALIPANTATDSPIVTHPESSAESSAISSSSQSTNLDLSEPANIFSSEISSAQNMFSPSGGGFSGAYCHTPNPPSYFPPQLLTNTGSVESNSSLLTISVPLVSLTVGTLIALRLGGFFSKRNKRNNELEEKQTERKEQASRWVNPALV
jgi:hypothetical protein